jgi:hypothetical protein
MSATWYYFPSIGMSVALLIQDTKRMRRIILLPVACLSVQYFSTLSHKWHDFQIEFWNIKCVVSLSLQLSFQTFPIVRRTERDIINVYRSSCKVPFILARFYCNLNFLYRFSKITKISNFMKISPVGAELLHVDRQMDRQT